MPEEFVVIALAGMLTVYFIVAKGISYSKWQEQNKHDLEMAKLSVQSNSSDEVTMKELESMMQKAVENGTKPLQDRILQLEKGNKAPLTDVLISEDPLNSPQKSVGRKEMA